MSQTRTPKHQLVVASVAGIFVLVLGAPLAFALVFGLMTGWMVSVAAGAVIVEPATHNVRRSMSMNKERCR